jgi:hypothetical protein
MPDLFAAPPAPAAAGIAAPPSNEGGAAATGAPAPSDIAPDAAPEGTPRPSGLPPGFEPGSFDHIDANTVSPEEQAQYDQFVVKALDLIHGPKTQKAVLEQINQKDMPVYQAVGRVAAMMAMTLEQQAKASGVELSGDVIFHAAKDYIIPEIFTIGEAAKILPKSKDDTQMNMAFLEAQKVYGEHLLQGPNASKISSDAQDFYAQNVASEMDAGHADPAKFRQNALGVDSNHPLNAAVMAEMAKMGGPRNGP